MWHDRLETHQQQGRIQVLGIIQEQHPDRCRLFMQWKRMDWPVLVDSLNLLQVSAVPHTLLIDAEGVIQAINPKPQALELFLNAEEIPMKTRDQKTPATMIPSLDRLEDLARLEDGMDAWATYARALFLWGGDARLPEVIRAYQRALERGTDDGWLHFRMGVAYRRLFDLSGSQMSSFRHAVRHWQMALERDPNQYIWRRRIQQYGPRLDKPYAFYDWVGQARMEVLQRGGQPHALRVEPSGAEFALPLRVGQTNTNKDKEPDPLDKVFRAEKGDMVLEKTVVASTGDGMKALRVHFSMLPAPRKEMYWNNEAEPLMVWIHPARGWSGGGQLLIHASPPEVTDRKPRHLEFELEQSMTNAADTISGYALYNVCESVNGICLYRREDFTINLLQP